MQGMSDYVVVTDSDALANPDQELISYRKLPLSRERSDALTYSTVPTLLSSV